MSILETRNKTDIIRRQFFLHFSLHFPSTQSFPPEKKRSTMASRVPVHLPSGNQFHYCDCASRVSETEHNVTDARTPNDIAMCFISDVVAAKRSSSHSFTHI